MSQKLADRRWPWIVASVVVASMFVAAFVEIDLDPGVEPRPVGELQGADVPNSLAGLRERKDLNVLFVLIDTLRADRLGSYGYGNDTSPNLDRVAAHGVRFARNLSQSSWTKSSMASLWTGLYPARNGILKFDDVIPDEARLPAEILREAGYQTIALYRNGWVSPNFGFNQGFEVYTRPAPAGLPQSVRRENPTITNYSSDFDTVRAAEEFLRVRGHEPWFLYLHLMDIHEYVYDEETALFGSTVSGIYDNAIRWTDKALGSLFDYMEASGFMRDTIIVIAADHGEAFLERGYEGHARVVYREETEVPLILQLPFRLEPGLTVETRSRNLDIWPTLFDILGLDTAGGPAGTQAQAADGRSLVPDMLAAAAGEPIADDRTAIAYLDMRWAHRTEDRMPTVAVAEGPLRYVRLSGYGDAPDEEDLFDAASDPLELTDRADSDAARLARLRSLADEYLELTPVWDETPTREIGELELNQLRALGYSLP